MDMWSLILLYNTPLDIGALLSFVYILSIKVKVILYMHYGLVIIWYRPDEISISMK